MNKGIESVLYYGGVLRGSAHIQCALDGDKTGIRSLLYLIKEMFRNMRSMIWWDCPFCKQGRAEAGGAGEFLPGIPACKG